MSSKSLFTNTPRGGGAGRSRPFRCLNLVGIFQWCALEYELNSVTFTTSPSGDIRSVDMTGLGMTIQLLTPTDQALRIGFDYFELS
jgi:hypothetical protein